MAGKEDLEQSGEVSANQGSPSFREVREQMNLKDLRGHM